MEERKSNYDITRDRVEGSFAGYDQEAMIRKFRLDSDEGFLYIRFAARKYRINRKTGRVERLPGLEHAGFNEVMTIFDVLCGSKEDCRLSGEFVRVNDLDGVTKTAYLGGNLFDGSAKAFAGRRRELRDACERLGGLPGKVGDVSYTIPLFDFFPVMLQFWDGDDEFPAQANLLFDRSATDFIHIESVVTIATELLRQLSEAAELPIPRDTF